MRYVISGGPCVGKTTVIEELARRGYAVVPEGARQVKEEELEKERGVLPERDPINFRVLVALRQSDLEDRAKGDLLFFDSCLSDNIAWCRVLGLDFPIESMQRSYDCVFLLDRLPKYVKDSARKEDFLTARLLDDAMEAIHESIGNRIVRVPVLSPSKRADFILDYIR